jgi:7-keto-8-aminopelargonate synthetase-like enzyme
LDVIETEPGLISNLHRNRHFLVSGLREVGYSVPESVSAIVPVIIGNEVKANQLTSRLNDLGVFVNAVSRPVVPRELSRLRVSVMATHTLDQLGRALEAFKKAGKEIGII